MGTQESTVVRENFFRRFLHGIIPGTKQDLEQVIEDATQRDVIDETTQNMLSGVLDINRLRISEIMIPRSKMVTIKQNSTIIQAVQIISKYGHSRYPVISEDKDHIVGMLMAKDLIPYLNKDVDHNESISKIVRPAVIVPESKRVNSMLREFRENKVHLAVVIDEYGGVCGLVTIEDILELIVGDISDEYDKQEDPCKNIVKIMNNIYSVDGSTDIDEFNEFFNTTLPDVDVDTIAGIVIHAFGHLPSKDEEVRIKNFLFKVVSLQDRQIDRLKVTVEPILDDE